MAKRKSVDAAWNWSEWELGVNQAILKTKTNPKEEASKKLFLKRIKKRID